MSKVTAPLLGFGAAGQIGKTQVYAKWRGRSYARRYTIPANPKTTGQMTTRDTFSYLMAVFKQSAALFQAPWTAATSGRPLTNRNQFVKTNLPRLRGQSDNTDFVGSPGANGGLVAAAASAVGGSGTITGSMTAPTLPADWTISNSVIVAIKKGDPTSITDFTSHTGNDNSTPYAPTISGLTAGDYVWSQWFVYTKADGSTAYGPSTTGSVTVT